MTINREFKECLREYSGERMGERHVVESKVGDTVTVCGRWIRSRKSVRLNYENAPIVVDVGYPYSGCPPALGPVGSLE